jgi:hypothetical protein
VGLHICDLEQEPVAGKRLSHINEPSGSINSGEILD